MFGSARAIALLVSALSGACTPLAASSGEPESGASRTTDERATTSVLQRQIVVTVNNEVQLDLRRAGSTLRGYFSPGAYRTSASARQVDQELARDYGLIRRDAWPIRALQVHCIVYEIPADATRPELLERLARDPRVESAQPMNEFRVLGAEYDDPYANLQHGNATLDVAEAHRWASGRGVRVGIIDTGMDLNHRELRGRVIAWGDFAGHDPGSFVTDVHGTAVAGVIAARGNNQIGIVGIAPDALLVAARACWYETGLPAQTAAVCSSFTLARALAYMLERDIDVLNLSLTGPRDLLLERIVAVAIDRGVVVVAAQPDTGQVETFPASAAGVLAVRDVGTADSASTDAESLFAPGEEILSLMPKDQYGYFSGASIATAHVSGIAALLREKLPSMRTAAVRDVLLRTAVHSGADPFRSRSIVNACAAVADVVSDAHCTDAVLGKTAHARPSPPASTAK